MKGSPRPICHFRCNVQTLTGKGPPKSISTFSDLTKENCIESSTSSFRRTVSRRLSAVSWYMQKGRLDVPRSFGSRRSSTHTKNPSSCSPETPLTASTVCSMHITSASIADTQSQKFSLIKLGHSHCCRSGKRAGWTTQSDERAVICKSVY